MTGNLTQHTITENSYITAVLSDMLRSGVTDVVGETTRDFFTESTEEKQIFATPNQPNKAEKPKQSKPQTKQKPVADLSQKIRIINEDVPVLFITSGAMKSNIPFTGEEETLFNNMLKAMGLTSQEVGYLVIDGALDIEAHQEALSSICRREISGSKANIVISLGEGICSVLMGGNATLSGARGKGKEVAGVTYVATYSPKVLLKQPLLKRLAWEDLQIAMKHIKAGNDA
jgi:uracil-DNA glycosylase family 4